METVINALPLFSSYEPALLVLALLCIINLIQSGLTAPFAFLNVEQTPGMPLQGDHDKFSFRVMRTYANSTESVPTFGFTLLAAVLLTVSPELTNWVAGIYLVSRVAFWVIYYKGVGAVGGGPRTICFIASLVSNLVLALACVYKVLV